MARNRLATKKCVHLAGALVLAAVLADMPVAAQNVPQRVAVEDLRLGGVNATEATAFIDEPKLMVDYDGHIYALTPHDVRVFDTDGRVLQVLGGDGDGPGEFRSAFSLGFLADTLWVIDGRWRPPRVTRFLRSTGKLLDTEPLVEVRDGKDTTRVWHPAYMLAGGRVLAMGEIPRYRERPTTQRDRVDLAIAGASLEKRKGVGSFVFPSGLNVPPVGSLASGAFPVSPLYSAFPDGSGVVTVRWGKGEGHAGAMLRMYDPTGDQKWKRVYVARTHPVTEAIRDSLIADGVAFFRPIVKQHRERGLPVPSDLKGAVEEGLLIPSDFPEFQEVVAGVDGSIWLHAMRFFGDGLWLALDAQGRPAFVVDLPPGVNLKQASLSEVWATGKGDYDAPLILRYRIEDER